MNMTVWNPFREMETLLDRYAEGTGRGLLPDTPGMGREFADWTPTVDISESDQDFLIKADVPGVDMKDIHVSVDHGVLSITGEKHVEKETGEGSKRHRTERYCGSFARRFTLPASIAEDKIDATYKDGVLSLLIPKAEEAKPKSIEIQVH
ncbi:MAG: Hsp20/alpha crystallin family protein [Gammaproteobacteria bacterium]|nr:Hsp20/alpha crystallin family protein [Gammaproteobacteria bacterium]